MVLLIAAFGFSLFKFCSSPLYRRATEAHREGDLANVTEASKATGTPDCLTLKRRTLPKLSHRPAWLRRRNIRSQETELYYLRGRARYLKGWGQRSGGGASPGRVQSRRGGARPDGVKSLRRLRRGAAAEPRAGTPPRLHLDLAATLADALLVGCFCLVRRLALP